MTQACDDNVRRTKELAGNGSFSQQSPACKTAPDTADLSRRLDVLHEATIEQVLTDVRLEFNEIDDNLAQGVGDGGVGKSSRKTDIRLETPMIRTPFDKDRELA